MYEVTICPKILMGFCIEINPVQEFSGKKSGKFFSCKIFLKIFFRLTFFGFCE